MVEACEDPILGLFRENVTAGRIGQYEPPVVDIHSESARPQGESVGRLEFLDPRARASAERSLGKLNSGAEGGRAGGDPHVG